MPEVASIFSGSQIGVETTSGTGVAADKLLRYLAYEPGVELAFNRFRPQGQIVASAITPGQDSTSWSLAGQGSYSELVYPFSGLWGAASIATVETSGRRWTWTPAGRSEITPKTFTVETGSSVRAQKATYVTQSGVELTFNRTDGIGVSGSAFGQQIQDGITLTSSPTGIEDKPILPVHLDVYVDATSAGLGGTKMTRDFNAVFRYNDARVPVWPINSTLASFGSDVQSEPTVQMELTMAADTQGMGFLTNARAGSTRYIRLAATSTAARRGVSSRVRPATRPGRQGVVDQRVRRFRRREGAHLRFRCGLRHGMGVRPVHDRPTDEQGHRTLKGGTLADEKTDEKKAETVDPDTGKVKERKSYDKPIVAPDGHVVLSQEDIDNRA